MEWAWQAVRYYAIAGATALFYLGVLAVALGGPWHYMIAILIAQVITISVAFPAHRTWVFRSRGRLGADFMRFLSVWAGGAIAGIVVTPLLVELTAMTPFVAQVVSIIVVSVASFLAHRLFSFRSSPPRTDPESHPSSEESQ